MKPLLLRAEDPAPETVIVRGGEMRPEYVRRTADRAHLETGMFLVSVFAVLEGDIELLCRTEPDLNRYGKIRTSTFGRLRTAGFALIATQLRPHHDVVLPDIDDTTLVRLDSCFDPPQPNPARGEES